MSTLETHALFNTRLPLSGWQMYEVLEHHQTVVFTEFKPRAKRKQLLPLVVDTAKRHLR